MNKCDIGGKTTTGPKGLCEGVVTRPFDRLRAGSEGPFFHGGAHARVWRGGVHWSDGRGFVIRNEVS